MRSDDIGGPSTKGKPWVLPPAFFALTLLLAGCGPVEPPPQPSELRIESGDQQSGEVTDALPQPLVVRVVDASGSPVAGVEVSWQVTSGGGSLDASSTSTDADGLAENRWSLGTVAGEQRVGAGVTGLANVEFRATAAPGPPHTILVSPERDTLLVNEARILDASVTDAHGNLIELSELELVWSSDEASVATVNEEGVMRALAPGAARVALTAGEAGATVQLTVVQIEPPPIPTRSVSGGVSLPVTLNAETDYVHTLWGGAAPVASDGSFTVDVAAEQASTISVLRGDRLLGLQILSPGESLGNVPLDPLETAVGLLYQNPILSSVPPQATGELLGLLRDQPETDELAGAIGRHLETHGSLLIGEDEGLLDAYREATAAAIERLLAMGEGEAMSANPAPGGDQLIPGGAGIWITAPPRDELEPEVPLKIENNLQRWVSVWEAPTEGVAPRGPASRNVYLPAADFIPDLLSVDGLRRWAGILWKLVSGGEYSPSEPVFTSVEFTHEQPRLVLMAYGPGLQSFSDDWADHLDASDKARLVNPYLATLFFEFVLPFTDLINTVELSSLDALRGMAEEIVEDLQAFVLAGDVLDCLARGAAGEVQVGQTLNCVAALLTTKCLKDKSCLTMVLEYAQAAVGDGQLVSFMRMVELKVRTLCPKCEAAVQFESFVSNSEHMFFSWKALEQARLRHDAVLSYNQLLGARELRVVEPEVRADQFGYPSEPLPEDLIVEVTDEDGNPVPNAWVTWEVEPGNGSVDGTGRKVTETDAEGRTTVQWTLGDDTGEQSLAARLSGYPAAVEFTATGFRWAQASAGGAQVCALMEGGQPYCWGLNAGLGDGTTDYRFEPTRVIGDHVFTQIAAGWDDPEGRPRRRARNGNDFTQIPVGWGARSHICGLTEEGRAYCWGPFSWDGQLGDGTTTPRLEPVPVKGDHTFASISAGSFHTCALTDEGRAYCWGADDFLGHGTTTTHHEPVAVAGGHVFTSISAGSFHTCALTDEGRAYCWGAHAGGLLGDGTTTGRREPVAVVGEHIFTAISVGMAHTCAISDEGRAYCWGSNWAGGLGDGTTVDRHEPVPVKGGQTFASISAGFVHTCALTEGGRAYCWGSNVHGVLGDGTTMDRHEPVPVAGDLRFRWIAAGELPTCAVTLKGYAYCWGDLVLGDGTGSHSTVPLRVKVPRK